MEILPIDKDSIPYSFDIEVGETVFGMQINYNAEHDFFTVDLFDSDQNPIVYGEKIVYGRPLFPTEPANVPKVIPLDISEKEDRVTYKNLGETVFLYLGGLK